MFCECNNIMVRYGRELVLDVEHLIIPAGRITAISGPNGAGKTTLLEVMALLRRPTAGQVSIWGEQIPPSGHRKLQQKVVMVMHAGYMFSGNVVDNVMFGLKARGLSQKQAKLTAAKALDMVGLTGIAHRDVAGLSAGQRQRVNLARAIAIAPKAILLDEPCANMDSETIEAISNLLVQFRDEQEMTIVHTCPANGPLQKISDKVVELVAGNIQTELETLQTKRA